MAYGKRTVILRGAPLQNEEGVTATTIKPGALVDGVTTIAVHGVAGGNCPRTLALEREELGTGIDATYVGQGVGNYFYSSGDTVKVGAFSPGMRATVRIASGQNIAVNDRLESAGDGTFRKYNSGVILGRSIDGPGAVVVETLLRMEWM